MNFSSKLLEQAVAEFSRLPGVGQKTALRLVLHLLKQPSSDVDRFAESLSRLNREIRYCTTCFNLSDAGTCSVCASPKRDKSLICVVEDTRDVMAIENTNQYNGVYHVLGGLISPMDGVGPSDLNIEQLVERMRAGGVEEVILAMSPQFRGVEKSLLYLLILVVLLITQYAVHKVPASQLTGPASPHPHIPILRQKQSPSRSLKYEARNR